ncbi:27434_t:CDS:2 [Racocetra persica]|uniref:27434_t:CDS:1 n=1 Tax=Racocetra persica TaxID=160502 RepID=A0ACA9ND77_9GLOM|nr:27434_t:CDS:2 [Racocetra persica]
MKHVNSLTDDILYHAYQQLQNPELQLTDHEIKNDILQQLENILSQQYKTLKDFPNMPCSESVCEFENYTSEAIMQREFANWLLMISERQISGITPNSSYIKLPQSIAIYDESY